MEKLKTNYVNGEPLYNTDVNLITSTINEIEDAISEPVPSLIEITYSDLKDMRDNGELVAGTQYRITDYACTTIQANTQSAGHAFDIIVTADDENTLNENARAAKHNGDTYFENANLAAWKLKYCIDNDTTRFAWADTTNGNGVIYYMKDEWNNECPYDFKNIQFKRFSIIEYAKIPALVVDDGENYYGYYYGAMQFDGESQVINSATYGENFVWLYTFALKDLASEVWYDYTIVNALGLKNDEGNAVVCYGNKLNPSTDEYNSGNGELAKMLNDIVFMNCYGDISDPSHSDDYSYCNSNVFADDCYLNTFGNYFQNNTFGNGCNYNTFGNNCYSNTFGNGCYSNTFGNDNGNNTFGNNNYNNTFGNECYSNTFGNDNHNNTFGNNCYSNTFGNGCYSNTFGNYFQNNTFGNSCYSNTFGNDNHNNTFGNGCGSNTFGNNNYNNTFGNNCYSNTFGNNFKLNTVGEGVCYLNFATNYPGDNNSLQYLFITNGTGNRYDSSTDVATGLTVDATVCQFVGLNSSGDFSYKCIFD